MTTNPQI